MDCVVYFSGSISKLDHKTNIAAKAKFNKKKEEKFINRRISSLKQYFEEIRQSTWQNLFLTPDPVPFLTYSILCLPLHLTLMYVHK